MVVVMESKDMTRLRHTNCNHTFTKIHELKTGRSSLAGQSKRSVVGVGLRGGTDIKERDERGAQE